MPPCWHIIYKRTFRTHFCRKVRLSEFLLVSNRYKQTLGKPWFLLDPFLAVSCLLRQETAKFMYKFIHKQLPVPFENYFNSVLAINKRSTRASQRKNQLYIPRFRTNRLQRSIKYRGVKVWNDIPNEIKNNNDIYQLSKKIHKKHLISQVI